MTAKMLSILLILVLLAVNNAYVFAQESDNASVQKIKDAIKKFGTGRYSPVEVILHNNQKWNGYISEANVDSFVLVYTNSGNFVTFDYSQVKQIKGTKLSKGKKITIGLALTGAGLFLIWLGVATQD